MKETGKDFLRAAYLARIEPGEEEAASLQGRFEALIGRFAFLEEGRISGELNLDEPEGALFAQGDDVPLREDSPTESTAAEALLAAAPAEKDGFFVVPRILEE